MTIPDGHIALFHRTTIEAAEAIGRERRFTSKEGDGSVYFSTREHGEYVTGYGEGCVCVVMPFDNPQLELDDEFEDGEMHFRISADKIEPAWVRARFPLPETVDQTCLRDLCEVIDNDRYTRAVVEKIAGQARSMEDHSEDVRARALGEEIVELFTRPVPWITTSGTELAPVARLVRRFFEHIDIDALGRHYLDAGANETGPDRP